MYLFFDTETNGFPPNCNMTQLAFILTDEKGEILETFESRILPQGWIVKDVQWYLDNGHNEQDAWKKGGFFTENNISTALCQEKGIPVFDALRKLQEALKKSKFKVAHNIKFDNKIVLKELMNNSVTHQLFQFKKGICTMMSTVEFVGAVDKRGRKNKWPNLQELHMKCFGKKFDNDHDALGDVIAMKDCFFHIKNNHPGIIAN